MPELPEVETISNRLRPYIVGKTISRIEVVSPKSFSGDQSSVVSLQVLGVSRRAKMIRFHLQKRQNILVHLKMTGQLIYVDENHRVGGGHPTDDWIAKLPSRHTRVQVTFNDGSKLFFNDQRLFGWMKVMSDAEVQNEFAKYAMDINSDEFSPSYFQKQLAKRRVAIKLVMLDNKVVAGIGNIYVCDALNLAKLSPFRAASSLTLDEIQTLYDSSRTIIQKGIDLGGATTDGKYIDVHGFAGKYQLEARVYGRKGQNCLNCGNEIVKDRQAGRGTYWCKNCQK